MMSKTVYAIATMDSKGAELAFVADCLRQAGLSVRTVDVGTHAPPSVAPDVDRTQVLGGNLLPSEGDRGQAIAAMSGALRDWLLREVEQQRVAGVIGIGGSGGTALITTAMRELPIGMPKVMVSTMASGNTAPFVDCSDITMIYSVVDVAGLNAVSRKVFTNAAHALAGMVERAAASDVAQPTLGMTMFGVTTPCVNAVREQLEARGFDCLVFHATGTGGRAMEKLVASEMIQGVLDLTTTEVADEVVGGIMRAGPNRFDTLLRKEIPLVFSLGAVDMVNFGSLDSVPERFRGRRLLSHNPQITLMRTTEEENGQIARWMADKWNQSTSPLRILIPEGGVSSLDAPGQPFHDPAADAALFDELQSRLNSGDDRRLVRLPFHINDPAFASAAVEHFMELHADAAQ